MNDAEKVVNALLDGKLGDFASDAWDTVKHHVGEWTGIGRDEFGMGKADKKFKPKFGAVKGQPMKQKLDRRRQPPMSEAPWDFH